jgi:hypothetical protein
MEEILSLAAELKIYAAQTKKCKNKQTYTKHTKPQETKHTYTYKHTPTHTNKQAHKSHKQNKYTNAHIRTHIYMKCFDVTQFIIC